MKNTTWQGNIVSLNVGYQLANSKCDQSAICPILPFHFAPHFCHSGLFGGLPKDGVSRRLRRDLGSGSCSPFMYDACEVTPDLG
ncbi:hypothetical protein ABIB57_005036, partial [Devosia sp. UYZn731]|uniref:hypothetical protein n=1 Tax=Devosia sp. UYZn731 TaxID=3156345 RepID=UPI0033910DB9